MRLPSTLWLAVAVVAACGGKSHPVCPSEKHLADPDGHGERCIDDGSTCDSPGDCTTDAACCEAACVDAAGTGTYQCDQTCQTPDCTEESCGAGWLCQPVPGDECSAYCVPDGVDCPDGQILADPTGAGTFVCVDIDSACLQPSDCPGTPDGCCTGVCRAVTELRWQCEQDCTERDSGAEDEGAREWECTFDADCENMMGQPGWTCAQYACGGNECVPPAPECTSDDDCILATDISVCCGSCTWAYSRTDLAENPCLVVMSDGEAPPDDGGLPEPPEDPPQCEPECGPGPVACPDIDCAMPSGVTCSQGQCVPF